MKIINYRKLRPTHKLHAANIISNFKFPKSSENFPKFQISKTFSMFKASPFG